MNKKPILFLIFNRPDTTKQVFEAIREHKPKQLFIAADGPRQDKDGEEELCKETREVVSKIDWDCEVKTLFRDENLGCGKSPSSAITWFFEHVEDGIILEDDCLPDQSFFVFCEKMLNYYRDDKRIMMVCGTNFLGQTTPKNGYFFSNYFPVWGWATWKRAWKTYDYKINSWSKFRKEKQLNYLFSSPGLTEYYKDMFNFQQSDFDFWDIQWWYNCIFNYGLSVIPNSNLISNLGLDGTHSNTQYEHGLYMKTYSVDYNKIDFHNYVFPDYTLNKLTYKMSHASVNLEKEEKITNIIFLIIKKVKVLVNKIKL